MTEATWALIIAAASTVAAFASVIIAALGKRDSGISASAARRSADAAEAAAIASHEAVAESKRANDRLEAHDLARRNKEVREELQIEEDEHGGFVLVNHGALSVRGIEIVDPPISLVNLPLAFDLAPRDKSAPFKLADGLESERPESLSIRWSGCNEAVHLDFPYDVSKSIG